VLVLHSFVLNLPECYTPVPEHVVVESAYAVCFISAIIGGNIELVCMLRAHSNYMNTLRGQSTEFCDLRAGGTYRNQFTLWIDLF